MKKLNTFILGVLMLISAFGSSGCDELYYYDDGGYYDYGWDSGSSSGTFCSDYGSGCLSWW